jgi:hypothetical protein
MPGPVYLKSDCAVYTCTQNLVHDTDSQMVSRSSLGAFTGERCTMFAMVSAASNIFPLHLRIVAGFVVHKQCTTCKDTTTTSPTTSSKRVITCRPLSTAINLGCFINQNIKSRPKAPASHTTKQASA